jgi:hypothetical protein
MPWKLNIHILLKAEDVVNKRMDWYLICGSHGSDCEDYSLPVLEAVLSGG